MSSPTRYRVSSALIAPPPSYPAHKTPEGTRLQLNTTADETHAIVVSTVMEVCEVFRAGLMADGTVKDVSTASVPLVRLAHLNMMI